MTNAVKPIPPSNAQFGLRNLLWLTGLIGLVCAALAPIFRQFNAAQESRALQLGAFVGAAIFLTVLYLAVRRHRVEIQSGPLVWRTTHQFRAELVIWLGLLVPLTFVWIVLVPFLDNPLLMPRPGRHTYFLFGGEAFLFASAVLLAHHFVFFWWWRMDRMTVEIRDHGVVLSGLRFVLWQDVLGFRWDVRTPDFLKLKLRQGTFKLRVPPEDRDTLDRLLRERLADSAIPTACS